jgi:hypothetical protein
MGSSPAVDRAAIDRLLGFAGRGACTDAERRAAAALHDDLRARGHEAWVEARWVRPQSNLSLLAHAALAVAGSLVSVAVPVAGAIAAAVAALSLAIEAAGFTAPLAHLLPRRATQHVLTVPPAGERVTLIVSARYDAPRRGVAASARLRRLRALLPAPPRAWLALCAAAIAAAAAARANGTDAAWLGAVQLLPTLVSLAAVAAAADAMASGWADGANDNASGVAVALALHAELARRPPRELAPALLLHGAGVPGPQALRAHLRAERLRPRSAVVLEVGPSGDGAPARAPRRRLARIPVLGVGATGTDPEHVDPATMDGVLDLALEIVDSLDAELAARRAVSA